MLLIGILAGILGHDADAALNAMLQGAGEAVTLCVSLCGAYMLWMGLMNIASDAGLIHALAKLTHPLFKRLFPHSERAIAPITLNLAANFFGMGSAATPFGLKAMEELKRESRDGDVASNDMCMFLSLNSSALELLPTSVLALRAAAGSNNVYAVVVPTFIASVFAFASAIITAKILEKWMPVKRTKRR